MLSDFLMKRTTGTETEDTDKNTETETPVINTPSRMSHHDIENLTSAPVAFEEVACQIKAVTDPLTQLLAHL